MSDSTETTNTATTKAVKPVVDPEYLGSLPTAFRLWANAVKLNLDVCQPCVVTKYNRKTHRATVKPLVLRESLQTGEKFAANTMNVSVWRWMSGGCVIDAPVGVGDTGWVIASDRNAIAAKNANTALNATGAVSPTADDRSSHILNSGFFVPDAWGALDLPSDAESDDFIITVPSGTETDDNGVETPVFSRTLTLGKNGLILTERNKDGTSCTVDIDPVGDLEASSVGQVYANFHEVQQLNGKTSVDSDGKLHFKTYTIKALADYSNKEGEDIVFDTKIVSDVNITGKSYVEDVPISVTKTENGTEQDFTITLGTEDPGSREEGGDDYCNEISTDSATEDSDSSDNDISNDSSDMGGGSEGGGSGGGGNGISYTKCLTTN